MAVRQEAVTDEQRRDPVAQAHFDRRRGGLAPDPRAEGLALPRRNADWEELVQLPIASGDDGTALEQARDHGLELPPLNSH